ncbi:hypothetical protein BSL78_16276 [Apostichopus japonicus]|uniref:Protein N-terminal glutamine amidohydrolase n=1 Tax=Stichopus japonicus TaxID=307972 RepID=A0A2G8KFW0_STIJA|nr:hypothetical protein BSL78_16276 [Apostichopus japonicus]
MKVYNFVICSEENIWKLCQFVEVNHKELLDGCFAVFISNENRQIPIWKQRASNSPDEVVVWDYHVILICQSNQKSFVYDLDSTLQFPCSFDEYVQLALRSDAYLQRQLHRMFRVIPGQLYLDTFASDRSHMKHEDGSWQ